jgi:hypothetical protein
MVVHLLLLVGDIDTDDISVLPESVTEGKTCQTAYFDVAHLDLLLLKGIARLALAVVECAIDFLAPALHLLADAVVFALLLAQLAILAVALLLQLRSIVSVEFAQLLCPRAEYLQGVGELGDEGASELVVFGGARFEGA